MSGTGTAYQGADSPRREHICYGILFLLVCILLILSLASTWAANRKMAFVRQEEEGLARQRAVTDHIWTAINHVRDARQGMDGGDGVAARGALDSAARALRRAGYQAAGPMLRAIRDLQAELQRTQDALKARDAGLGDRLDSLALAMRQALVAD